MPDGIDRERVWLEGECPEIKRALLSDIEPALDFRRVGPETDNAYLSYPVHSFSEWIQEFRMIGYLQRLANLEDQLDSFDVHARTLWLQAINSDVFSAVEKDSPVITLRTAPPTVPGGREIRWTLQRSERGFEGEEFLELLERGRQADCPVEYSALDQTPFHIEKLRIRTAYVASLHGQNRQSADVDAVS